MNEPHDRDRTVGDSSAPADSLEAGLAAGFGRPAEGPRSALGAGQRPVVLRPAEGESDHVVKPRSDAMPAPGQAGTRYQLSGEIARGGMGAVLRGRDVDLGRDLAVKVLLEKYAHRPEVARRFLGEAQVGAQLQHPGVVPVYDVGHFGGRPFFTMKLVKGHTLAALLAGRERPAEGRPRLLGVALKVAEAVAYAHAKGVIHRDLKPANVMLGPFGEVQVMDWGLAKVLQEGGVADEERASRQYQDEGTQVRTARSGTAGGHGSDTEAGSLLGTPAYMAPEQANGDVASLDRRADVFGLGALLCEVLTGKPPYVGRSAEEVRRRAANGDLADAAARLADCGAEPELIALTRRCLSPEAADRPRDARAVAEGLSAYLEGVQERLQAAQRERAAAVAREAERRKRRKVQLALAAAVLALVLGGGGVAWWHKERGARNAVAVAMLLGEAEEALKAGDATKAAVALDAAGKRSAEGGAQGQAQRLGRLEADLTLLRDLDAIDQFYWGADGNHLRGPAVVATRAREALRRFGVDPDAAAADEAVARVSASAVRERIVTALHQMWGQEKTAGALAVLRRVDADPYRDAARDAILANQGATVIELSKQDAAPEQPPGFVAFLCAHDALGLERRRQLLEAAANRRPGNLLLLMTLGNTYPIRQKATANERLRWFQATVAVAPTNPAALSNLGNALGDQGRRDEAIAYHKKAIERAPEHALYHTNLGVELAFKGQTDRAIDCFRKAIALDPNHALGHYNLGLALDLTKNPLGKVLACYTRAVELDPNHAEAQCNLGQALARQGRFAGALEHLKRGHKLGSKRGGWAYPSAAWVRQAEASAALEAKLPAFLKGEFRPGDNKERLALAEVCYVKKLPHAAAGLYAAAFAAAPGLADDRQAQHRYNAACNAALAAAGQGEDAAKLDDKERMRLRKQALDWLRADLDLLTGQLGGGKPADRAAAQQSLRHWQQDTDLTGLRDKAALANLPAEEREAFARLWADVAATLKKAEK